jgi:hypothetical protein
MPGERTMKHKRPFNSIVTFEDLKQWLDEVEGFAKGIQKGHLCYNRALHIFEYTYAIRSAATLNNDAGQWHDSRLDLPMRECELLWIEAVDLAAQNSISKIKSENASKIRNRKTRDGKAITKASLEIFREKYKADKVKDGNTSPLYGWKKAACDECLIDIKTLNKIIRE